MIDLIQSILFVVGAVTTAVGLWIISPSLCMIVSGLGLMAGTVNGMIHNRKTQ